MLNINATMIYFLDKISYIFIYLYSYLEVQYVQYIYKPNDTLTYTFSEDIDHNVNDGDILKIINKYKK
jgi:hypothetical protein